MRLIGQDVLSKSIRKHSDTKKWLEAWAATVEEASWESLDEVRVDYPSADGVKLRSRIVVTVFNVKGNEYRLLTNVVYAGKVAHKGETHPGEHPAIIPPDEFTEVQAVYHSKTADNLNIGIAGLVS